MFQNKSQLKIYIYFLFTIMHIFVYSQQVNTVNSSEIYLKIKKLQVTTKRCAFLIALFRFDYKRLFQPTKLLFFF